MGVMVKVLSRKVVELRTVAIVIAVLSVFEKDLLSLICGYA